MVDILKTQKMPAGLTSYDLLKALALLLMFVDHIGYFFYPEEMWWRTIGRLSVPIWFFLIGYANTREIPRLFWAAGVLVVFSALMSGEYLFPVTIIFTLIWARYVADWLFRGATRNKEAFSGMFFFLFLLSGPTLVFVEYGTLGLLFTLLGVLRRNTHLLQAPQWMFLSYTVAAAFAYVFVQSFLMPTLSIPQFQFFVCGMTVICFWLYNFKPVSFEKINLKSFPPVALVQLMGRRTLEIYALHLVALRIFVVVTNPERFPLFDFQIFAFKALQQFFFNG